MNNGNTFDPNPQFATNTYKEGTVFRDGDVVYEGDMIEGRAMSDQAPNIDPNLGPGRLVYNKARRMIVAVPNGRSLSDINDLDDVCKELGIQDSHVTPAEAVRELNAEIERLRAILTDNPKTNGECADG